LVHRNTVREAGHDSPVADPATQGFAHVQAPIRTCTNQGQKVRARRDVGRWFEIEKVGAL